MTIAAPEVGPVKDEDRELPVPVAWRPTFRAIVRALIDGDVALGSMAPRVVLDGPELATDIARTLASWGEALVELPEATWETSISLWEGAYWSVMIDLWTAESGRIDLVLETRVYEAGDDYRFVVHLVYVP